MKRIHSHQIIILILILASVLRFFHYSDRIIVSQDQGRDAVISLEAIRTHTLPLLGPTSSAWGFNFGALYYYFIILFSLVPLNYAPWIGFTCLSILSVYLLYKTGEMAINKKFGYLLGFIGAISFAEISNSVNLLNTALVSFAVCLSFFAIQKLFSSKNNYYGILLGFAVGLAINAHLQSLSLLCLIPLSLIFYKRKVKNIFRTGIFEVLGFTISFIPLIIFEIQHNLAWTKSVIDYSLHVGEKFYVPIRWLTDITQFWPDVFGKAIFGSATFGLVIVSLVALAVAFSLIKKKLPPKLILISMIAFALEIISVRYYKGPRSSEYFVVVQPFAILFFSWAIWQLISFKKILGIPVLILLSALILNNDLVLLNSKSFAPNLNSLFAQTKKENKNIKLYLYENSTEVGNSFYYLLQKNNLLGESTKLAICDNYEDTMGQERCPLENRFGESGRFVLYKLSDQDIDSQSDKIKEITARKLWNDILINY